MRDYFRPAEFSVLISSWQAQFPLGIANDPELRAMGQRGLSTSARCRSPAAEQYKWACFQEGK